MSGTYIVRAHKDGIGRIHMFGLTGAEAKLLSKAKCNIGGKDYKVSKEGYITIPKKIMNEYGITGSDNRKRVGITFSSKVEDDKRTIVSVIIKPNDIDKDRLTNWRITEFKEIERKLKPSDSPDYNWSLV